jgi:hypothetical protein
MTSSFRTPIISLHPNSMAQSYKSSMLASGLDVAARSTDLVTALVNASNATGPAAGALICVWRWLGREKMDRYELQDCLQKARGLAFPNRNAQEFFDGVLKGAESHPTMPLFTQTSGSLERLMAKDPELCWVVSTVACVSTMTITPSTHVFCPSSELQFNNEKAE